MAIDFGVSLSVNETVRILDDGIVGGSVTGERIDDYAIQNDAGQSCVVLVYEKHYVRAGNRLTLTVTVDDLQGRTHVHAIGGGGGEGLFRFDWGASESFTEAPHQILRPYVIG